MVRQGCWLVCTIQETITELEYKWDKSGRSAKKFATFCGKFRESATTRRLVLLAAAAAVAAARELSAVCDRGNETGVHKPTLWSACDRTSLPSPVRVPPTDESAGPTSWPMDGELPSKSPQSAST